MRAFPTKFAGWLSPNAAVIVFLVLALDTKSDSNGDMCEVAPESKCQSEVRPTLPDRKANSPSSTAKLAFSLESDASPEACL